MSQWRQPHKLQTISDCHVLLNFYNAILPPQYGVWPRLAQNLDKWDGAAWHSCKEQLFQGDRFPALTESGLAGWFQLPIWSGDSFRCCWPRTKCSRADPAIDGFVFSTFCSRANIRDEFSLQLYCWVYEVFDWPCLCFAVVASRRLYLYRVSTDSVPLDCKLWSI